MKYVRIPASRIGALIGPGGKTKRKLDPHNKFQSYQSIKLGIF